MLTFRNKVQHEFQRMLRMRKEYSEAHAAFMSEIKKVRNWKRPHEYRDYLASAEVQNLRYGVARAEFKIQSMVQEILEDLNQSKPLSLEKLFAYLMVKEKYYRSGYTKETMLRKLKHVELDDAQKEILREIIIDQIDSAGREFSDFVRLIPKIKNDDFMKKIVAYDNKENPYIKKRLERMIKI